MSNHNKGLILLLLTLLWPALQLGIFFLRFGAPPATLYLESLAFAPIGLLGGWLLLITLDRSATRGQTITTVLGFVVMTPVATAMSLGGGLMLPVWLGPWLFGVIPLVIGTGLGFLVGRLFRN